MRTQPADGRVSGLRARFQWVSELARLHTNFRAVKLNYCLTRGHTCARSHQWQRFGRRPMRTLWRIGKGLQQGAEHRRTVDTSSSSVSHSRLLLPRSTTSYPSLLSSVAPQLFVRPPSLLCASPAPSPYPAFYSLSPTANSKHRSSDTRTSTASNAI